MLSFIFILLWPQHEDDVENYIPVNRIEDDHDTIVDY